ncbi:MAG: AhpC/TSA family protein [Polyangiaceae bacterium]|nr:AhpC/TSA family protein [Polyangiaceae bacterium]
MPNDAIFEVSGIAQVVPAFFAAIAAVRFVGDLVRAGGPRTPGQLQPGDHFDRRHLVTVRGERIVVPDERRIVHLQFRRFAGCPVCNLHLRSIVRRHDEIVAAGIHEVVFFHSSADDLREHTSALPFHVVADPDKHLYDELGVESSPRAMLDPRAWIPIVRAVLVGAIAILRGRAKPPAANPHGGRYGLPADLLIDTDGRVLAAHYGEHVDDQWSVDEVLELAARPVMRRAETTLRPAEAP